LGFWHWHNIRIALAYGLVGKRPILTEHISWHHVPLRTRLARRLVYRIARSVVVVNPPELAYYSRFLRNVTLIPNPIPKQRSPLPLSREKLILAVGHLSAIKNFADAIRAMSLSGLSRKGWRLRIVGDGPQFNYLKSLIITLGLSQVVDIASPTDDIAELYARASIILVTSTVEVFSLVLAESMLSGVVPLSYASDGPSYILEKYPELLVRPMDVKELSTKLARLAEHENLDSLRPQMKDSIEERFSTQVVTQKWRNLFAMQ
jgi:glycosyltransferase involved in cell wall biosynthesis